MPGADCAGKQLYFRANLKTINILSKNASFSIKFTGIILYLIKTYFMLKKAFTLFIFLFILLLSKPACAQKITQFSGDTLLFPKELAAYFDEYAAQKKEAMEYAQDFVANWKSEIFGEYKKIMIETANMFVKRRLKPFPYFVD